MAPVRVLHISGHPPTRPGSTLAERLADQFDVAAVVDTGDMGTWGLAKGARWRPTSAA